MAPLAAVIVTETMELRHAQETSRREPVTIVKTVSYKHWSIWR